MELRLTGLVQAHLLAEPFTDPRTELALLITRDGKEQSLATLCPKNISSGVFTAALADLRLNWNTVHHRRDFIKSICS